MKKTTTSLFVLMLIFHTGCSDSHDSREGDSSQDSANTAASSSDSEGRSSGSGSESMTSQDLRCDLKYDDAGSRMCPWDQENLHWGFFHYAEITELSPTCWPTHYGATCDDPAYGHPFNSIEECLDACPEARNVVEDNFTLQKCDGLAPLATPYHFDSSKVDTTGG